MIHFTAHTEKGLGRGKGEFVPTVNLSLDEIPPELEEGIYACTASFDSKDYPAVMHYGPRPAVSADKSCEVHFIDEQLTALPPQLSVSIVARLRDVQDFADTAALKVQIEADIAVARAILKA